MSVTCVYWAWAQQLGPVDKLVLLALAERADSSGVAWPPSSELRARTGLTGQQLGSSLCRLRELGRVETWRRPGFGLRYRLLVS